MLLLVRSFLLLTLISCNSSDTTKAGFSASSKEEVPITVKGASFLRERIYLSISGKPTESGYVLVEDGVIVTSLAARHERNKIY